MDSATAWVMPFTFLSAIGLLILSTANRFHHVNTLIRGLPREQTGSKYLKKLLKRSRYFHNALTAQYLAMAFFAVAALLGNLSHNWLADMAYFVHAGNVLTTLGVASVVFSAWQLIRESALSFKMIRSQEYLHPEKD